MEYVIHMKTHESVGCSRSKKITRGSSSLSSLMFIKVVISTY